MEFSRITSAGDKYVHELIQLYIDTFPLNQRHTENDFKKLLENEPAFHCNAVLMNKELVGFFNYWEFGSFVYLEHIAIEPPMRGHKLGEKIILLARSRISKPLFLEVEKEDGDEWNRRRIEFYKRLGFDIVPCEYRQPPYRAGEEYLPLYLMSDNIHFAVSRLDEIVRSIYRNVYKVE